MWGIEFFDEAAKNRRTPKPPSPKSEGSTSNNKQVDQENTTGDDSQGTGTQSAPDSSPSVDKSPQSNQSAVISEQAEPRPELPNDETSEEKIGEHVTTVATDDSGTSEGVGRRRHVTPNLREETIDEDYVIIHKRNSEDEDIHKPGIWHCFRYQTVLNEDVLSSRIYTQSPTGVEPRPSF